MLLAVPIVLACYGAQPCQPLTPVAKPQLVRSLAPAAIVSRAQPREDLTTRVHRPFQLALQGVAIPSTQLTRTRAQVALPRGARTTPSKAMLVFLGVVAGCYAGAYLGEAMEENGWFPGMTIGAAAGGLIAWGLVR